MHEISRDEALAVLEGVPVVHVGMIDGDRPYVTPMSFVVDGDSILLRTLPGRKLDAITENPSVCVEASHYDPETGDWESVIALGTASVIEDTEIKEKTVSLLFSKYERVMGSPLSRAARPQLDAARIQVIRVEFDEVTGRTSGKGFAARSRPGRL